MSFHTWYLAKPFEGNASSGSSKKGLKNLNYNKKKLIHQFNTRDKVLLSRKKRFQKPNYFEKV
jgi:hypothetical protein